MFSLQTIKIINSKNGVTIGNKIEFANTFVTRLKGLLGRISLSEGQGLLLVPCSSIHCIGMKFAIDAVFLNQEKQVIGIRENMIPGTRERKKGAYYVLELASGVVKEKDLQIGDRLEWIRVGE